MEEVKARGKEKSGIIAITETIIEVRPAEAWKS
jgi:hypothetical protein